MREGRIESKVFDRAVAAEEAPFRRGKNAEQMQRMNDAKDESVCRLPGEARMRIRCEGFPQ